MSFQSQCAKFFDACGRLNKRVSGAIDIPFEKPTVSLDHPLNSNEPQTYGIHGTMTREEWVERQAKKYWASDEPNKLVKPFDRHFAGLVTSHIIRTILEIGIGVMLWCFFHRT